MVEFVNTFGRLWETPPISLAGLQQALESPEDHPQLGELYPVLLSCVLLDQVYPSPEFVCIVRLATYSHARWAFLVLPSWVLLDQV